ncbi:translocon-associated protein subunit gamma [Nasonia vitripennis]|uniref:Translocon-associated protein subunit gamma n=1 Tax=Nasonia vitripennis TaxID=7425 RepID=A0A7M7G7Y0_NASVI|nr:translocon-associated protein subunit gamma [Nasonia vitripennis]
MRQFILPLVRESRDRSPDSRRAPLHCLLLLHRFISGTSQEDKRTLKMSGKSKAFTKEEELLLQDFSRNVSTKSSALFYGNALIVSAIPIWLFWRIHLIDVYSNLISFVLVTLVSTYALAFAYKNTKYVLKHKIAVKREDAVTREMSRKLAEDKKMSRKEKDERILWKKNEVADYEATTFSIFYNNALFLAFVIICSFYILKTMTPAVNYVFSVGTASALLALLSTGSQ